MVYPKGNLLNLFSSKTIAFLRVKLNSVWLLLKNIIFRTDKIIFCDCSVCILHKRRLRYNLIYFVLMNTIYNYRHSKYCCQTADNRQGIKYDFVGIFLNFNDRWAHFVLIVNMVYTAGENWKEQPVNKFKLLSFQQWITRFHLLIIPIQVKQSTGYQRQNEI